MRRMIIDIHYDYDHDNCSDNYDDDDPCNEDEKYKQTKNLASIHVNSSMHECYQPKLIYVPIQGS